MKITEETRRESFESLDNETVNKHIVSVLENGKELTAREIAAIMYTQNCIPYPVRQAVAPRLTELTAEGVVKVTGKAFDKVTGRKVAVYKLVES